MSLILTDTSLTPIGLIEGDCEDERDIARLDTYLALIETNKNSCNFVPDDALVALDMAGFVRNQLAGGRKTPPVSVARMALALAQPCAKGPVQ